MEHKVINVLFDSTSCCDRDSVAWQLPVALRWLFWLRGECEVALPALALLRVPAPMEFLPQIDVSIAATKRPKKGQNYFDRMNQTLREYMNLTDKEHLAKFLYILQKLLGKMW